MKNEPSPRPWRVEETIGGWKACVSDRNGNPVASCWGGGPTEQQEKAEAIAALIVDAVNWYCDWGALSSELERLRAERDRLRDIVRRTVETLEQVYKHADMTDALREVVVETQREARAAIGEGETPTGKGVGL